MEASFLGLWPLVKKLKDFESIGDTLAICSHRLLRLENRNDWLYGWCQWKGFRYLNHLGPEVTASHIVKGECNFLGSDRVLNLLPRVGIRRPDEIVKLITLGGQPARNAAGGWGGPVIYMRKQLVQGVEIIFNHSGVSMQKCIEHG